jgi:nitrite reductase (NO-forming)
MKRLRSFLIVTVVLFSAGWAYGFMMKPTAGVNNEFISDDAENTFAKGYEIYKAKCAACHQMNGEGVPSAFPPLKNSDYLLADKKRAVEQVLNGSNHEITVNGAKYNIPMPPQVDNYEDAVAVVNYILNAWGNHGGTITVDEVKDIKIKR